LTEMCRLPLAPGVALSRQMLGGDGIVACFFGDGAATEGIFHESVNLASVWNLPILYICENNQWQAYVHRRETMKTEYVSEWGRSYGIKAQTVDGNDVTAVALAAKDAVDYVRRERKPFLLETYTYRLRGHMEPDDQKYVNAVELAAWKARDPIASYEQKLVVAGTLTRDDIEMMRAGVHGRIEAARQFALESPYPSFEELTTDVYA
jgi:acetoin:2,6-dichlorophenolindophenol oxidoreductase subunit alpha